MKKKSIKDINSAYTSRTCNIIENKGRILLKNENGWYVGFASCIAAGEDGVIWMSSPHAQEFGDLQTAFAFKKAFSRNVVGVVVQYPHKKKR